MKHWNFVFISFLPYVKPINYFNVTFFSQGDFILLRNLCPKYRSKLTAMQLCNLVYKDLLKMQKESNTRNVIKTPYYNGIQEFVSTYFSIKKHIISHEVIRLHLDYIFIISQPWFTSHLSTGREIYAGINLTGYHPPGHPGAFAPKCVPSPRAFA